MTLPVPSFLTVTKPQGPRLRTAADLFPYQQKAIVHQTSMANSMMWLDMGLGKTVITLSAIAHLRKLGVLRGVIIVAPIRVCKMVWRQEALKWEHTKHLTFSLVTGNKDSRARAMMQPADVYLVNYENLKWLSSFLHTYYLSAGIPVPANGLVWDECFVKGTLVQTPDSHIAIDKLKIGDVVSTHIGPRRVLNTMQKTTTSLVDVRLSNGSVLRCTPNHPFSVGDDWVAAGNLKKGDVLNEAPQHSEIRGRVLSDLPGGVLEAEGRAVHLFQGVREHLEDATTRSEEGDHFGWDQGATETPRTVRDLEQGDSLARGNAFKNERVTQEARSLTPERRERDGWLVGRELVTYDATAAVPARVHFQGDQEVGGLSDSLQDRLCGPCEQDSYRSSGSVAQYRPWENEGREEATSTGGTWVESVLHHEQGSGVDVWNIHVEEAETYYVGGVLVHNCSKMKNSTTNRVKSYLKIEQCFDWTTGLTGTPASNGYKDLHGQYLVIDKGQRLGRHKTPFKTKFYHKEGPYKEVPMANAETDIKALISDITLEMSAADYNPLPDMIVNDIAVEMTGELRDNYERLEREMFLQLDECTVEVFNKAALMNKCLQYGAGAVYVNTESHDYQEVHDLKLDALEEIIDEAQGNPVLCAYSFKSDADRIMKRFKELNPINLTECKSQRALDDAMKRWKSGECLLMIGHPASMGHGIDGLQDRGNTLVWFGLSWSLDLYEQMNARIRRQGQGRPVMCHRIMVTKTVDQIQAIALDSKATTQDGLRRSVKQYRLEKGV